MKCLYGQSKGPLKTTTKTPYHVVTGVDWVPPLNVTTVTTKPSLTAEQTVML